MQENLFRVATRKSPLALWQARYVCGELLYHYPCLQIKIVPLITIGDISLDASLANTGGKRLFTNELEQALIENRVDIAVHSMKDVAMPCPDGLGILALCKRDDPRDAFISLRYANFKDLPPGALIGTSSLRRQCQLLEKRPDIIVCSLRGNISTRLAKLDSNYCDAIILAVVGLKRLGLTNRICQAIDPTDSLPAAGQGVIGVECRLDDFRTISLLSPLNHKETAVCVKAELAMHAYLQSGGCQVPIGSYAVFDDGEIWLRALVGMPDGTKIIRSEGRAPTEQVDQLVVNLAENLLEGGATSIITGVSNNNVLK